MAKDLKLPEKADLPVYYMKMKSAQADARLGKMRAGQVVAMDEAKAIRYLSAGVAEQVPAAEFEEAQERKATKQTARQNAFAAINDGHALWDVSTYRDVLTAPEGGLRLAHERGIPLVNVHMLRDEDGDPLPPDADIEDILDARELLHADIVDPTAMHDRSSVMGGGSPYVTNVQGGPQPLSPRHRAMAEKIAENETMAAQPAALLASREADGERGSRAQRRARTLRGEQGPTVPEGQPASQGNPAPPPAPVAPTARAQAEALHVPPPKPASEGQIGNKAEKK